MPLEPNFRWIDDLDPTDPTNDDFVEQGDDHFNGVKGALQGSVTGDGVETRLNPGGPPRFVSTFNDARVIAGNNQPTMKLNNAADATLGELRAEGVAVSLDGKIDLGTITIRVQRAGLLEDRIVVDDSVILKYLDVDAIASTVTGAAIRAAGALGASIQFLDDGGVQASMVGTNGVIGITGQAAVSEAAPAAADQLTRKDYVDDLVASLQAQITALSGALDDLIDGTTKFTGAQEAPDFTAVP